MHNCLKFSQHISSISKKSAQRVGVLMRLRNLIPTQTKLQLYKAAVLPYLTYCHLIWHFCRASDSRRLERIQERAPKAIYCDKHSSYGQLLSMAGLSTLNNRRLQDIAILMYKVKNNMCPTYIILALSLNSLQLSMNCAIMTNSLYPDSTQSPLENTRSGIWAQRYGVLFLVTWKKLPRCPPSNITSEKWILACY